MESLTSHAIDLLNKKIVDDLNWGFTGHFSYSANLSKPINPTSYILNVD